MSRNRRRHPRVRARGLAAHLRTGVGRAPCLVENISLGGLFVRTDQLEEVGTEVGIELVRPGWKRALDLEALVTSRVEPIASASEKKGPGMGLQFVRVGDNQFDRLRLLLRDLGAGEGANTPADGTGLPDQPLDPAQFGGAAARAASAPDFESHAPDEVRKLMIQIKGLVMQLAETQEQVRARDLQIERLQEELDVIRGALSRAAKT